MPRYRIYSDFVGGTLSNIIQAPQDFVDRQYPGLHELVPEVPLVLTNTFRENILERINRSQFHKWRRVCVAAEGTDTPTNDQMNALLAFEVVFRSRLSIDITKSSVTAAIASLIALGVFANQNAANAVFFADH